MRLRLTPLAFADAEIPLDRLPVVLGRSAEADVAVPDQLASRRHCRLEEQEGRLSIRDLGSTNGTFVNGERVESAALAEGDVVTIGISSYRIAAAPSVAPPRWTARRFLPFLAAISR